MSVLIKNMKMPTNCFLCPLSVLDGERLYCEVTKDEVLRAKKTSGCPLVEVPTPHGRLIDATTKLKVCCRSGENDDWQYQEMTVDQCCGINYEIPTVIEAEEDG